MLRCALVVLTATTCFADETAAQLRGQNEVLRQEMAIRDAHINALEKHITAQATTARTQSKESVAKLAAIKAVLPAKDLASIVSVTATEQCAGLSAMAVLEGRHDECAPTKKEASALIFRGQALGERLGSYGGSRGSYGGGYGDGKKKVAKSHKSKTVNRDTGALAR